MSTTAASFYVTGGTLRQDAPSYVERQADHDLHQGLVQGEFCYVLTARQMGKSSLMIHTAARLRDEGVQAAILDLTAIGQNLSPEQWYGGLLRRLGRQLDPHGDLEEELEEFWFQREERVGPLERWMRAMEQRVLPRAGGRIVIFIDEIDAVRSLPFSTDEFFAAIRECYNRRTTDTQFQRLTFCLLGVASPSNLIRDTRMTPFNIGRRIELTDFTPTEAAPLVHGLGRKEAPGQKLLERVLYWTGGHPYLTQRLCQAVAQDESATGPGDVDRHCEALFLSPAAQERDDNLLFVRERLLRSEVDLASLLDLYAQVRIGKRVVVDDTSPLFDLLRLSGIARVADGRLQTRNHIYSQVFDRAWVTAHMPDAELRRQRSAYRRGLLRAATVGALVAVVMAGLALTATSQAARANRASHEAHRQRQAALTGEQQAERLAASLQAALRQAHAEKQRANGEAERAKRAEAAERGQRQRAQAANQRAEQERQQAVEQQQMAEAQKKRAEKQQRRANRAAERAERHAEQEKQQRRMAVERELAAQRSLYGVQLNLAQQAWEEGSVARGLELLEAQRPGNGQEDRRGFEWRYLWRLCQGDARLTFSAQTDGFGGVAVSPDGQSLAIGSGTATIRLWDLATGQELATLQGHTSGVGPLAFSLDGRLLASGSADGSGKVWDLATRQELVTLKKSSRRVENVVFSPDGRRLGILAGDGTLWLWDIATQQQIASLKVPDPAAEWVYPVNLVFSPDGRTFATPSGSTVKRWDAASGQELAPLAGHTDSVMALAYSPDGQIMATGGKDNTIRLWEAISGREVATLFGHAGAVQSLAFAADGRTLASGSSDSTVKLWDLATRREVSVFRGHRRGIFWMAFTSGRQALVTASWDGTVKLWEQEVSDAGGARRDPAIVLRTQAVAMTVASSPDGQLMATGSRDGTVRLWDTGRRQIQKELQGQTAAVTALAFSPNGGLLAGGSEDGTGCLWETASGRLRTTLAGHQSRLEALAYSPDGRLLATGGSSADRTVRLWDGRTGQPKGIVRGLKGPISALAFSPNGKILAVCDNGTAWLWQLATQWPIASLPGRAEAVRFLPDGKSLLTTDGGTLTLWDLGTRQVKTSFRRSGGGGTPMALSPDGKILAAGTSNSVTLWNLLSQQEVASLKGHTGSITAVAFSADGNLLVTAANDATVRLWPAAAFPQTDLLQVVAGGGDRKVRLQWRPLRHARAYNVYRLQGDPSEGSASGAPSQGAGSRASPLRGPGAQPEDYSAPVLSASERVPRLVRLNARPLKVPAFSDQSPDLVNGQSQSYAVSAIFRNGGKIEESPPVRLQAVPMAAPPGWVGSSLNESNRSGSVLFHRARNEINLRGSGADIYGEADGCYFLNQPVTGDFRITVKLLAGPIGGDRDWAKAGLMIRDSVEPGARNVYLSNSAAHGLIYQWRPIASQATDSRGVIQNPLPEQTRLKLPILLRLTRRGDMITAEYSRDNGKSFEPAAAPFQFETALPRTVFAGLAITAHDNTRISEARFRDLRVQSLPAGMGPVRARPWPVLRPLSTVTPSLDPDLLQVVASTADKQVRLQWEPLPTALAYHVYRGPAGASLARMVKLTARPVRGASFLDDHPSLVKGRPVTYAVAPIFQESNGQIREGMPVRLQVTPGTPPPGFEGSSIQEGPNKGAVSFQPTSRQITLRGAGRVIAGTSDSLFFLHQPVAEDFQVTVRLLAGPTDASATAKAGLMVSDSLDPGTRRVVLFATSARDLRFQWRAAANGSTSVNVTFPDAQLKLPILLRLTREGSTLRAEYSEDEGKNFQPAGDPVRFDPLLPRTLHVGLVIASENESQTTEARFDGLQIRRH